MLRTIERDAVRENQTDVLYELLRVEVARVGRVRVGFCRVGCGKLALDGGEVHWTLDDLGVMGDAQRDRIDGIQEGTCVLHLLQRTNGG